MLLALAECSGCGHGRPPAAAGAAAEQAAHQLGPEAKKPVKKTEETMDVWTQEEVNDLVTSCGVTPPFVGWVPEWVYVKSDHVFLISEDIRHGRREYTIDYGPVAIRWRDRDYLCLTDPSTYVHCHPMCAAGGDGMIDDEDATADDPVNEASAQVRYWASRGYGVVPAEQVSGAAKRRKPIKARKRHDDARRDIIATIGWQG